MSKDDSKAFIFTLKNPHGVEPTRFMKKKESKYAIHCDPIYGPLFRCGNVNGSDIYITDKCNKENCCSIDNDGTCGYDCHPQHKASLFVNTSGPDRSNPFTVLDYEVFGIDYENRYTVDHLCKHPDIIW